MVPLAPSLQAILNLRLYIESGQSVSQAIKTYIKQFPEDFFAQQIAQWLFFEETGRPFNYEDLLPYRKNLIETLKRGLDGEPILETLNDLEREAVVLCKNDLEKHLQKLPFIFFIPLLIFQFPAFILLFLGPLVFDLIFFLQN